MTDPNFVRVTDFELNELVRLETVAETTGASVSPVARLYSSRRIARSGRRTGFITAFIAAPGGFKAAKDAAFEARSRRQFGGASIILDLVEPIELLNRTLAEMQRLLGEK